MQCEDEIDITGYVGGDVRAPFVDSPHFLTFSVAVHKKYKDEETTTWYKCVSKNERLFNLIKNGCTSGSKVRIRGIPKLEEYINKEGKPAAKISIYILKLNIFRFGNGSQNLTQEKSDDQRTYIDDEVPF